MMRTIEIHRLTTPELLTKHELCQILEETFIEPKNIKKWPKTELIEIYKRIAMPLPQRQPEERENKEENKNNMNGNSELEESGENVTQNSKSNESNNISSTNLCKKRKTISQENLTHLSSSSIDETESVSKKICLSTTSKVETDCNGITEHKINKKNEDSASTSIKKRQKITWP